MRIDRAKTIRGAMAGTIAAAVWAAQIPLDRKLFGSDFNDVELLGKGFTRGHGALFGALYANLSPRLPLPSWSRGPAVALTENFATWPLTALTDRVHPARADMPKIFTSPRALAQSTWRHLLFGVLLGEIERRLNAPDPVEVPDYSELVSSNGHGHPAHVASVG
jgi:hypothetical protein